MIIEQEKEESKTTHSESKSNGVPPAPQDGRNARCDGLSEGADSVAILFRDYIEDEIFSTTPLLLTRGAHTTPLPLEKQKTIIDWVSFTTEETIGTLVEFLSIVIPKARTTNLKHGMPGYKYVKEITLSGQTIGRLGYGAKHERNLFTLTGQGTKDLDLSIFVHWFNLLNTPRLSRLDIAMDIFDNSVNHDSVFIAYQNDKFKPLKASQRPSINTIGTVDGKGNNKGRTITIGNKKSGKLIRCYEKGLERFAKLYENILEEERKEKFIKALNCSDIEETLPDVSILNWYRLEVQYGNNDRELNIDMIINRDNYFSGSYPFCQEVLNMTDTKTPPRIPNNLQTEEELMFKHMSDQYGSFVYTMLCKGENPLEILKKIIKGNTRLSQRFIKAGGLDDLHPFDIERLN